MFEYVGIGCELKSSHDIIPLHDVRICTDRLQTQELTQYINMWCSNMSGSVANSRVHVTLYYYLMFEFARIDCELKSSLYILLCNVRIFRDRLRSQEFIFEYNILVYESPHDIKYVMFGSVKSVANSSSRNIITVHDVQICTGRFRTQERTWYYIIIWCSSLHGSVANLRVHMKYHYMMLEYVGVGCELRVHMTLYIIHGVRIWTVRLRSQELRFQHTIYWFDYLSILFQYDIVAM